MASVDPRTGAPSFVWSGRGAPGLSASVTAGEAALAHLAAHADLYGLSREALATARVSHVHDTGRGGILVVVRQELSGIPLYHHEAKVMMRRDRSLVALSGGLHPLAISAPKSAAPFVLPVGGAVARALSDLYSMTVPGSALSETKAGASGEWRRFELVGAANGGPGAFTFESPARARKVYFPMRDRLVPAYYVELFSREPGAPRDAYGYVVAADDGSILRRRSLIAEAAFKYRVFADTTGDFRPLDGPIADFTPHPTGTPDGSYPSFVSPSLITIDGFNELADPWLPEGATESQGNNVDAYTDHDDSNNVAGGDVRATITAPGELDHTYDVTQNPDASDTQMKAAVTQLFYTINWLHDYWYDSGFDEAAGNAQQDNYGRGGEQGDRLRAEGQDALDLGASNNANMETPEDGQSPRMQMYVWDGIEERSLSTSASPNALSTGTADFGPPSFDLTGEVALVDDGSNPVTNGCEDIQNDVAGKIALVDRGQCTFHEKAVNVGAAGAIGMILVNNQGGPPPDMPAANFPDVAIPVMSITQGAGNTIKTALGNGTVTATMKREAGIDADGTIDNLVVAHEWGHYLHHRLVACGLNQCGAESEGWGDFLSLTVQLREGDDLDGTFADSVYAGIALNEAAYFGIRRFPYSVDMTKNPLTFKHIMTSADLPDTAPINPDVFPDNAEVHNAGEVWTEMMFEGFVALLKKSQGPSPRYTFDEGRRRMTDYVVGGMKLAPVEPTFTEQRDAIIAAAFAADPEDAQLIAEGFARRGAGSCAVSPPKDSFDNEGVVESFVVGPAVSITAVDLDDSAASCDMDGLLDANETGKVTVTVQNFGFIPASGTVIKVSSSTPGVTFPNGAEVSVAELEGFGSITQSFDVQIDPDQDAPAIVDITVVAENPMACNPSVLSKQAPRVNYDNVAASSTKDDFESDIEVWTPEGELADQVWARAADETGNNVWHGVDYSSLSDTALVSPPIQVSATENLVLSFRHRHKFETSNEDPSDPGSPIVFWDGSVIEISSDGGASWTDVSQLGDPGYGGQIGNLAENPLSDRMGYVDVNNSYPDFDEVSIDMGTALAGQTIQIRFRIGSDQAASEEGWEIDDVSLAGVTGAPFPSVTADAQSCSPSTDQAPVANAGPDVTVKPGEAVTLDGSQSSDPDGDDLWFDWTQVDGPEVTKVPDGATLTFTAPDVTAETELTFALKVTAKKLSNEDTVKVIVKPAGSDVAVTGGGCGCSVPGEGESPAAPLGALGAMLAGAVARWRRRRTA